MTFMTDLLAVSVFLFANISLPKSNKVVRSPRAGLEYQYHCRFYFFIFNFIISSFLPHHYVLSL